MSAMALAVSVISLLGWLALNVSAFRDDAQQMGWPRAARMALAWGAIIAGLAWLVTLVEP